MFPLGCRMDSQRESSIIREQSRVDTLRRFRMVMSKKGCRRTKNVRRKVDKVAFMIASQS